MVVLYAYLRRDPDRIDPSWPSRIDALFDRRVHSVPRPPKRPATTDELAQVPGGEPARVCVRRWPGSRLTVRGIPNGGRRWGYQI